MKDFDRDQASMRLCAFITSLTNNNHHVTEVDELLLSGVLDSLSVMRLVGYVEHEFGIHVPPEDVTIETLSSVASLLAYIEAKT